MEPDIFSGDVTALYKNITAIPTTPVQNHLLFDKHELNIMYKYQNISVPSYPPPRPLKLGKLPYIFITVFRDNETSFGVFGLVDTGCTTSMISSDFVEKFPQFIKDQIVPLDLKLGVASSQSYSKIVGSVDLLLTVKSSPGDRYPLIFSHTFLIGYKLSKDMFIGYDLLGHEEALVSMYPDSIALRYPPHYEFLKDPYDLTGFKHVPFIMMDADEAAATNNNRVSISPQEQVKIQCKLTKPLNGELVHIRQFSHYNIFESYPMARDNMPEVFEDDVYVDENNCVYITCTNRESNYLTIPPHFPFARIVSYNESESLNFNVETNLIQEEMSFYSNPKFWEDDKEEILKETELQTDVKLDRMENHWLGCVEDDPVVQEVPNSLENIPEPNNAKSKSDFTEQQFLDMFDFSQSDPKLVEDYKRIVLKYRQAFAHFPMDILECTNYVHEFEIIGKPQLPKFRPPPDRVCEPVNQMIDSYIDNNVMSNTGPRKHFSNIVPVIKPNGTVRTCVDMILINRCIKSDDKIVLMGSPQHIFQRLHEAPYFLILDHHSAYYHLKPSEFCRQYYGIYSYRPFMESLGFDRVIQGEKTAVYSYNKMSNQNYGKMQGRAVNWIDDWCLYANTKEELLYSFEQFCKITQDSGLSISPSKSCFSEKELHFLGIKFLRKEKCRVIPEATIQGILDLKPPVTWKQLRSFLSTLRYYNGHMPGVAIAATPLQLLLRKATSKTFKWTDQLQKAWLEVKQAICESVALYDPYPGGIFRLYTDASHYTYSMMLYSVPKDGTGDPKLVATASGTFSEQALGFSIYHKELLAVVYAVRKWIPYFFGARIELYTDNKALLYLAESKSDFAIQYRLAMQLSSLNISFEHCKGVSNPADYSSRQWQAFLDQTLIKNMSKNKRTQQDVLDTIANMTPKKYYSPEEVKVLLTHNFKTPFDVERLQACEEKYNSILSQIKYEKPVIKAGSCSDCKIEISQVTYAAKQDNFPLPSFQNHSTEVSKCRRCNISYTVPLTSATSAFHVFGPPSKYEINASSGNRVLDYFEGISHDNIMHESQTFGFSLIPETGIKPLNAIHELRAFNYFTTSENSLPKQIFSNDMFLKSYGIFDNFPYIYVGNKKLYSKMHHSCKQNKRCLLSHKVGASKYESDLHLTKKFLVSVLPQRLFRMQVNSTESQMRPYQELTDPFQHITPLDRLKAKVFKFGFLSITAFQKAQNDDFHIAKIKKKLLAKDSVQKRETQKTYALVRDIVFRKTDSELDKLKGGYALKLYIPNLLIPFVLQREHVPPSSHMHIEGGVMLKNMQQKYFFPNMKALCYKFVKSCIACAYVMIDKKPPHFYGKTKTVFRPMGHIMLDFAVSLPPSKEGYVHILILVCTFTRFVILMPCKTRSSSEILKNFQRSFLHIFGFPEQITADQELGFHNGEFYDYMSKHGVLIQKLMAYRPHSAGRVESQVRRVKHALATFAVAFGDRDIWPQIVPLITRALNSNFLQSIGMSPFHALFCFEPHDQTLDLMRMDTVHPMPENIDEYTIQRIDRNVIDKYITLMSDKAFYLRNKHLNKNTIDRQFHLGQKVMRKVHYHALGPKINRSLMGKFVGPFTVVGMSEYCLFLQEDAEADYYETLRAKSYHKDTYTQHLYPPDIVEHKSYCKPFNPDECDFILTTSFMKELDKVTETQHRMTTRAKARNQNHLNFQHQKKKSVIKSRNIRI